VQLVGVIPEKTIKLFVHDFFLLSLGEVGSGALAGCCQVIVTNPLEIVKVRMQLAPGKESAWSVVQSAGFLEDPRALYAGSDACVARDSTFAAVLFPTYAYSKSVLAPQLVQGDEATWLVCLIAGALAAVPAALLTTPGDVVKTRLQQQRDFSSLPDDGCLTELRVGGGATPPESAVGVGLDLWRSEGLPGLFQGCFERVLRSAPQFGVTLATYDILKSVCVDRGLL